MRYVVTKQRRLSLAGCKPRISPVCCMLQTMRTDNPWERIQLYSSITSVTKSRAHTSTGVRTPAAGTLGVLPAFHADTTGCLTCTVDLGVTGLITLESRTAVTVELTLCASLVTWHARTQLETKTIRLLNVFIKIHTTGKSMKEVTWLELCLGINGHRSANSVAAAFHLAACVCTSSSDKELIGADKAFVLTHAPH